MKHFRPTALLASCCLCVALAGPGLAEEPAATPNRLMDLLPEGGFEAVEMDFYLIMEMEGGFAGGKMYMHWQIQAEDGQLTVSMEQGSEDNDGFGSVQSETYGPEGRLVQTLSAHQFGDQSHSLTTGVVEGDQIRITTRTVNDIDGDGIDDVPNDAKNQQLQPYDPENAMLSPSMLPLAIGYHLREENPSFIMHMREPSESTGTQIMACEDIGTEQMIVGGQEREIHVIVMRMSYQMEEEFDAELQADLGEQLMHLRCLPSGEIVQMKMSVQGEGLEGFEGMTMEANWATAEQVREQFPKAGELPVDEAAPAEEAQPAPAEQE